MTQLNLPDRIRCSLADRLPAPTASWIYAAALAFEDQLVENRAPSHAELMLPIAHWLDFPEPQLRAMGDALDLLQVAFDYADNLVDADADAARGRKYQLRYRDIPCEAAPCLPALLCSLSLERLVLTFGERGSYAIQRVVGVLADMARGQGSLDPGLQVELISGRQALLLCLPVWLSPRHDELTVGVRDELERWAVSWGNTWQLQQQHRELGTAASHFALSEAIARAHACWPQVGPFRPDQRLAAAACLSSGVC